MGHLSEDLLLAAMASMDAGVAPGELKATVAAWAAGHDAGVPLADILRERGLVDKARLEWFLSRLGEPLRFMQGQSVSRTGPDPALAPTEDVPTQVEGRGTIPAGDETVPEDADETMPLQPDGDPEPDRAGDATEPAPGAGGQSRPCGSKEPTPEERYRLLRLHARGGIGQVWLARDRELQREVALKEILPKYVDRQDQRARFILEAEITGNLEHPGIVPVYSLGRNAQGRPYYAMRFIRGESLAVAIQQFHSTHTAPGAATDAEKGGPFRGVDFQQLLRRFLDVCDALDFAHDRNVIHRDLKPGNIMLGPFGETLVVDWGLAKVLGRIDIVTLPAEAADPTHGPFEPGGDDVTLDGSAATLPGTTIGTPAYMSPEQARGAIEELGPASDVYSLGATLYELVTGKPPFSGKPLEIVRKVVEGKFDPPRARLRSIPPPLEAICLKAMAMRPEERYPSVRALSRDLEHWLADEPVSALPERAAQRIARWLRRHRSLTYATTATLLAISLAASMAAVLIEQARRGEEASRKEAQANFSQAQETVNRYLTSISEDTLLKEQDLVDIGNLRRKLLQTALEYYQQFVRQRSDDPGLRKELANSYYRVGLISRDLGSQDEGLAALLQADRLWDSLLKVAPNDDDCRSGLARTLLEIGKTQMLSAPEAAMGVLNRAVELLAALVREFPHLPTYRKQLAECYQNLGEILSRRGDPGGAIGILEKARVIDEELAKAAPGQVVYKYALAEVTNIIGFVQVVNLQAYDAALATYQDVKQVCRKILEAGGRQPVRYRHLLAIAEFNIGISLFGLGRDLEAVEAYRRGIDIWSELTRSHPSVPLYKEYLAKSNRELGQALVRLREGTAALDAYNRSREWYEPLCRDFPDKAEYHSGLAYTLNCIGVALDTERRNRDALEYFRLAIDSQRRAIEQSTGVAFYAEDLCLYLENLGEQYVDLGEPRAGLPEYDKAMSERHRLAEEHPDDPRYSLQAAGTMNQVGEILRHLGDFDAAAARHAEAASSLERPASRSPDDIAIRTELARCDSLQGKVRLDQGRPEAALPLLEGAVSRLRALLREPHPPARVRWRLHEALWDLRRTILALHRPDRESAVLRAEITALWGGSPVSALLEFAHDQAARASVIAFGQPPEDPHAKAVREADIALLVDTLRLARSHGPLKVEELSAAPDLRAFFTPEDLHRILAGPK